MVRIWLKGEGENNLNGTDEVHELARKKKFPKFPKCFSADACAKCDSYSGHKCLYMRVIYDYFKEQTCNDCGKHAIMFNAYNNIVQCHHCGRIWCEQEKVMLT